MNSRSRESATTIRYPATANLMIDSDDRNNTVYVSPWDFQITKPNALLYGFFSRIGATEVTLEWCLPNISTTLTSNTFEIDISGTGANVYSGTTTITLPDGFYTVEECIDSIVASLNAVTATTGAIFNVNNTAALISIDVSGAVIQIDNGATLLNSNIEFIAPAPLWWSSFGLACPDLRPYRYIDFVSSQLTYAQDVKDSSTSDAVRDVLCRWYFAEDTEENLDAYGFPILMGYKQFRRRRIFNPPKQIKWDSNLPIGNIGFQVYDPFNNILPYDNIFASEWLMTLQVSEN